MVMRDGEGDERGRRGEGDEEYSVPL